METKTTALSPPQPLSGQRVLRITGTSGSTTAESADSGGSRMASAQRTGKRTQWTNEDNRAVMRAYYRSSPSRYGYRQRMLRIWRTEHHDRDINERRLTDQRRVIERSQLLSREELEQVHRETVGDYIPNAEITPPTYQFNILEPSEETLAETPVEDFHGFGKKILESIVQRGERDRLPPLKGVNKKKLALLIEDADTANCR
jgi:hypothetical protein